MISHLGYETPYPLAAQVVLKHVSDEGRPEAIFELKVVRPRVRFSFLTARS
jgi:hypothetical protein